MRGNTGDALRENGLEDTYRSNLQLSGVTFPNLRKQQMPHSFSSPGFSPRNMGSACSSQTVEVQHPMICIPMASFPQTSQTCFTWIHPVPWT
jgi:hypothetical protein